MEEHVAFWADPATWVSFAVTLFFVLIIWKKVPAIFAKMLDDRSMAIEEQLENARSLSEEASALLAKYERDQHDAEKQAAEVIEHAKAEVKLMIAENKVSMKEMAKRRAEVATQKISQAEAAAIKEIRSLMVSVATAAARDLIEANLKDADQDTLIKSGIDGLETPMH